MEDDSSKDVSRPEAAFGYDLRARFEKYVMLANAGGLVLSVQIAANFSADALLVIILTACALLCFSIGAIAAGSATWFEARQWFANDVLVAIMKGTGRADRDAWSSAHSGIEG